MKTKSLLSAIVCSVLIISNVFGQKDCKKQVSVSKNEFTDEITVSTNLWQVMGKKGAGLFNLATGNDYIPDWLLYMGFLAKENKEYVVFQHQSSSPSGLEYVYIKFTDETVLKLEKHITSQRSEDGLHNSYIHTFFEINEDDLKVLEEKDITKMQASFDYQPRESYVTTVIDKKSSLKLKSLAMCFIATVPKNDNPIQIVKEQDKNDKPQIQNNGSITVETIKPLGNNDKISIYKQWKTLARLNKEGIPMNQGGDITQYFEDGTYKSLVEQNGKITELKGKFSLISDNKIIVFYLENGGTYSAAITKLTNSELEIKSEDYTLIYSVY